MVGAEGIVTNHVHSAAERYTRNNGGTQRICSWRGHRRLSAGFRYIYIIVSFSSPNIGLRHRCTYRPYQVLRFKTFLVVFDISLSALEQKT